nr:integrase, catalytic region, zinc finger, CCHC-type, peptidase aspartic, catalytic [Tanacetum cinerariifolium]
MHNNSQGKKQELEDHRRSVKLSKNKTYVTACNDSLNAKTLNVKYVSAMCDKCVLHDKHDMCVLKSVAKPHKETVASKFKKKLRNFTRKLYERVSKTCSWWYPKFTPSGYKWKPKSEKENVNLNLAETVLFIVDSGCSKHTTGNLKLLINFVEKFLGTVKFGNDQIAPILGYGDLVVSKSSVVSAADAPFQRQNHTNPLNIHTTPAPTYNEFINIFSTPIQDQGETSSRHVDSSNMHTFYQRYPSEHRWTKDHPLEQVIGNPSQSIRTRSQLKSDAEMCMFALIVSQTKPKNIKEAMADSAWIESMQEELHQF